MVKEKKLNVIIITSIHTMIAAEKKVCWKDNCKYTKNNPVKPKHSQWLKIKHASDRGCCSGGGSACDWCAPFASEEGNDGKGNLYTWNMATVGTWGGTCTCPDGGEYFVGDNWDGCGSLACFGGTSSGCNRWVDEKWAGRSVICAGPEVAEESVADEEMLAEETVADEEKPKVSLAEDVVIDEGPSTAIVMLGVIGACAIMCQILQRARKCAHSEEWTPIIEKI